MSQLKSIVFFEQTTEGLETLMVLARPLPMLGSQIVINSTLYIVMSVHLSDESNILEIYHVQLRIVTGP